MKKEEILKTLAGLKLQRSKVIKGKHASPQDMMKQLKVIDTKIERHQLELEKLGE